MLTLPRALVKLATALVFTVVATAGGCDCGGIPSVLPVVGGDVPDGGADAGCDSDDDCALGEQCVDAACVAAVAGGAGDEGCVADADCADGQLCARSTGACVNAAPTPGVPGGPPGACVVDEERTCGVKIGQCDYGIERCVADASAGAAAGAGVWSGECLGAIGPSDERCDGVDNDCDADVDEDFPGLGGACFDGVGVCRQEGVTVCADDGGSAVCTASALDATGRVELCGNGADDDCNGDVDEGFEDEGTSCSVGTPPCASVGTLACSVDLRSLECALPPAGNEVCNGSDDDGDTCVDEGFALGVACSAGVGVCERSGVTVCSADGLGVQCGAVPGPAAGQETCDGDDDDCNTVVDNGCDDDGDDYCDATLALGPAGSAAVCPLTGASAALRDCNDARDDVNPGESELCNNGIDEDCDGTLNNGCAQCNPGIDADFDGSNQCDDCDETNGAVRPGIAERCNGVDENCNGQIDETFDVDGDGFTTCGSVPGGGIDAARIDCNDTAGAGATIFPGACELCANAAGTVACGAPNDRGNNVDEDCDGFSDELCSPCSNADPDGDGLSECEGDCAVNDPAVFPGASEVCDGKDNDCNTNTVQNCDVSDECNFDVDNNGVPDNPQNDECGARLLCVEALGGGGQSTGNFSCTSTCNVTAPGAGLGDSCNLDETCTVIPFLTPTAGLHGCAVTTDFGAVATGLGCSDDSDCRSGRCVRDDRFTGPPGPRFCQDSCGSDDYCPNGTRCQAGYTPQPACWPLTSIMVRGYLADCSGATNDLRCISGPDTCVPVNGTLRCTDVCCDSSSCAAGSYCSLEGEESPSAAGGVDVPPVCFPRTAGNGGRPSGAACTTSTQCASEFCDVTLGICIDLCCHDASCPSGQLCEVARTRLDSGAVTFAHVCLASTPASDLEAR